MPLHHIKRYVPCTVAVGVFRRRKSLHRKRYVPCRVRADFEPSFHCHVIEMAGIATGVTLPNGGFPLTAFRWRCKICGVEIVDISEYGVEQLRAGHATAQVFEWL